MPSSLTKLHIVVRLSERRHKISPDREKWLIC
uniref:Uncharacterized protein n=1 Tax=Anguilla anguilla TaxID=7936 RepID=A0A0E9SZ86_ANGAN